MEYASYYWIDLRHEKKIRVFREMDGGSVMICAEFSWHGNYTLAKLSGHHAADIYCGTLDQYLVLFVAHHLQRNVNVESQKDNELSIQHWSRKSGYGTHLHERWCGLHVHQIQILLKICGTAWFEMCTVSVFRTVLLLTWHGVRGMCEITCLFVCARKLWIPCVTIALRFYSPMVMLQSINVK